MSILFLNILTLLAPIQSAANVFHSFTAICKNENVLISSLQVLLQVTLAKKQCRLDIRKFSFSQRTVNEWNRLSADCVSASSVNMFKNKIDMYLRRAGYI